MAKKTIRAAARRPTVATQIDTIRLHLVGVRSCVVTTEALLEGRGGLDREIATNLWRGAVTPVRCALELLEALGKQGARP
jgi:hypothetical protein